jgi:hypothetical protein
MYWRESPNDAATLPACARKTVNERYIIISIMLPATIVSSQFTFFFPEGGMASDEDAGAPEVMRRYAPGNLPLGLKRAL